MNLKQAFKETRTENGDIAYNSSLNKYIDLIFRLVQYRKKPNLVNITLDSNNDYDKWFARVIRDCRYGFGEREVGRVLLEQIGETPINIFNVGRADDIFELGYRLVKSRKDLKGGEYWQYLYDKLINVEENDIENFNIRKWLPRERGGNIDKVKAFRKAFGLSPKQYRKLISNTDTVEAILSSGNVVEKYENVPSLAMLKHFNSFIRTDKDNFEKYLESVRKGTKKMNTSTTTPYDIALKYEKRELSGIDCDLIFEQLPKIKLGKIIPIVDNSGSMFVDNSGSMYDSEMLYLKARAIGHYVSKNSSYMNNHIITFSSNPKLLELGDNYIKDMEILDSFDDVSNTDFGKVMDLLSRVTEDLPDYLLVLSDMQFDRGSSLSKENSMEILQQRNPNLRIIWWNFNTRQVTFPETDEYGNIFLSGYNPFLLKFLEVGFNGQKLIDNIVNEYKEKMKDIIK